MLLTSTGRIDTRASPSVWTKYSALLDVVLRTGGLAIGALAALAALPALPVLPVRAALTALAALVALPALTALRMRLPAALRVEAPCPA